MLDWMQRELRYFLLALGFFTRIPVPEFKDFQESDLNQSAKYFPMIGILVGGMTAMVFLIAVKVYTQDVAIILSMIAGIYITGAFHEDGLSDATDGLGGGWYKEHVLTIMQDSRIGSYGAIAITLALLLKFSVLNHLPAWLIPWALIAGHSTSRLFSVLVMATQAYVKPSGKAKPLASKINPAGLLMTVFLVCCRWVCFLFTFYGRCCQVHLSGPGSASNLIPGLVVTPEIVWVRCNN